MAFYFLLLYLIKEESSLDDNWQNMEMINQNDIAPPPPILSCSELWQIYTTLQAQGSMDNGEVLLTLQLNGYFSVSPKWQSNTP